MRSFASDNNAPVAPEIMKALNEANTEDAVGYGRDDYTERAVAAFRAHFGAETGVYFAFNGTGANVVALSCVVKPWEAVLCPASAHLQTDECGAFERFTGSKVIPVVTADGKMTIDDLVPHIHVGHDEHHSQPRAISLSQSTEYGDVYEPGEIRALCEFAHEHGLVVHVDGARIANAAAALNSTPRAITKDLGVDILSFGGTKNGLMYGEAICFFNPELAGAAAPFARKQAMQLASKMRYVSAQFEALLANDLWLQHAAHANAMTTRLLDRINGAEGLRITRPARCNAIFATMDRARLEALQERFFFYLFDERLPEARWMTHWATAGRDVDAFAEAILAGSK
ncbi:MAG TPA: aminotransferase class I/II-fold pyridoxal phosphate-dependent enzyme [Candidatus Baltobacteraceae bacterium]|nr:aminotransferase class I/II-fold pyridoxal phosphate-dependent enzyme [Candidatus Baltobacteraceae bacterium]